MQRSYQKVSKEFARKVGEASSLSSFISVSMILLAFLVALNATRNTQVTTDKTTNQAHNPSTGQFPIEEHSTEKQLILREKIALSALFDNKSAALSNNSYTLATAIAELIKGKGITSIFVLDASKSIDLSLQRTAALHRLLLDSGLPQELFSIVTATANEQEPALTIIFKEGSFDDQQ